MKILTALFIWIAISYLWAEYKEYALPQLREILGVFLLSFIFTVLTKNKKILSWIYFSYIVLLVGAWFYAKNNILAFVDVSLDDRFRLNDDKLNANMFAYMLFYATVAIYILSDIVENKKYRKIWRILFWTIPVITFYLALLTASRQILIIQIPLFISLIYIRYLKEKRVFFKYFYILLFICVITVVLPPFISIYKNSFLAERNETRIGEDSRYFLALDAIKVGIDYFPFGVGPNNYVCYSYNKHFSHNTYTELFANEGIIGLGLYLALMFLFLKKQWRRYKKYKDNYFLVFFIIGLIYVFDGFFYVFYARLWYMAFFILVASHSEQYWKSFSLNNKRQRNINPLYKYNI